MSLGLIYSTVMLKLYVTPYLIQHVCYSSVKKKSNCGPKAILMVTIQPTISVGVAVMCVSSIGDRSGSYEKLCSIYRHTFDKDNVSEFIFHDHYCLFLPSC